MEAMKSAISLINDLIERDNAELTVWAIDWLDIDLVAVWPELDDEARDSLVEYGIVDEVTVNVECVDVQSWSDEWQSDCGASWPTYHLEMTADGMPSFEVIGWHCVGYFGPDGNRRYREWDSASYDGSFNGLPSLDGWELRSGDNLSGRIDIPCWRQDGRLVTIDRTALEEDIKSAADTADHGEEPSWKDVTIQDEDKEDRESVYVLDDEYRIKEIEIWHGGLAPTYKERGSWSRKAKYTYAAEAWGFLEDGRDDTYETRAEIIEAIQDEYDTIYDDQDEAELALIEQVEAMADDMADYEVTTRLLTGVGVPQIVDDEDEESTPYELSIDDMSDVLKEGWGPLLRREGYLYGGPCVSATSHSRIYDTDTDRLAIVRGYGSTVNIFLNDKRLTCSDTVSGMAKSAFLDKDRLTDQVFADSLDDAGLSHAASVVRSAIKQE